MMTIKQVGLKTNLPAFRPGDNVRVHVRVVEGDNERVQYFDGVVMGRKGSGISETFTVRKVSFGVGVERVFPLHSPRVEKIEIIRSNKVRRAKLYYLRELSGKAARLEETGGTDAEQAVAEEKPAPKAEAPAAQPEKKA